MAGRRGGKPFSSSFASCRGKKNCWIAFYDIHDGCSGSTWHLRHWMVFRADTRSSGAVWVELVDSRSGEVVEMLAPRCTLSLSEQCSAPRAWPHGDRISLRLPGLDGDGPFSAFLTWSRPVAALVINTGHPHHPGTDVSPGAFACRHLLSP